MTKIVAGQNGAYLNLTLGPFVLTQPLAVTGASASAFTLSDGALSLTFGGSGFTYDGSGQPLTGTITRFTINLPDQIKVTGSSFTPTALMDALALRDAVSLLELLGNITYKGGTGTDHVTLGNGNDVLYGNGGGDSLSGGGGNDVFYTAASGDGSSLAGGPGDDTYYLYRDDSVTEASGQGNDVVYVYARWASIAGEVETIVIRSPESCALNLIYGTAGTAYVVKGGACRSSIIFGDGDDVFLGRSGRDTVWSNAGDNRLSGGDGDDVLTGSTGNDWLAGGAGNDRLTDWGGDSTLLGGAGDDTFRLGMNYQSGNVICTGGAGNDTYYLQAGMQVVETKDAGTDTVVAGSNTVLARNLDNLVLVGKANSGTGNDLDNVITGNDRDDDISGLGGNDTVTGGGGDDVLIGGGGADVIIGGDGLDYASYALSMTGISANLGNTALNTGDAAGDTYKQTEGLVGSRLDDNLSGNAADNSLFGGGGRDVLTGGGGADLFAFELRDVRENKPDHITDFHQGVDHLEFAGLRYGVSHMYIDMAPQVSTNTFIFDSKTSTFYYDDDGSGAHAAVAIAIFDTKFVPQFADFLYL